MSRNLAIIGASYLQLPLIDKAKKMGFVTHVFAWECGDVGESAADHFYPVSIVEKEEILRRCREIGICGICSIASDLAMVTVNYVAEQMNLTGNSVEATAKSTNKHLMRRAFEENGDPSPKSILVDEGTDLDLLNLTYPVIVKPTDRSGSRGIFKLESSAGLMDAVSCAMAQGFEKKALIEEYATGQEYSVEFISYQGEHHFLALTQKFTTGAPHFIETGHIQPAPVSRDTLERVKSVVSHALDSLDLKNGASHSEIKIDNFGNIRIIEIGGRMGGDFIGSNLVPMSTGIDFVKAVIQIAAGECPDLQPCGERSVAAVRFVFSQNDLDVLKRLKMMHPDILVEEEIHEITHNEVTDSSNRFGYYLMQADSMDSLMPFLPDLK